MLPLASAYGACFLVRKTSLPGRRVFGKDSSRSVTWTTDDTMAKQLAPLGYSFDDGVLILELIARGTDENLYRDQKRWHT
jgi:hypothetical protein